MKPLSRYLALALLSASAAYADTTPHDLSASNFSQNWSNAGLITVNDNWSGVPAIEGFLGQDITTTTATDPQTLLTTSALANDLDVVANQTNPNTLTAGGVAEFAITDPVAALQGSGTADAPYLLIRLNTTNRQTINVAYNLRDIDGSTDNAIQPVALQYRVGSSGNFINLPAGFVADASSGPSAATLVTPVAVTLPAAAENQAQVQVRVITANAAANDEWIGVDDIVVTSAPLAGNAAPTISATTGLSRQQGTALSNSTIATVTDDAGNGTVVVTGASTVNGITLSNIVNAKGTVTGDLIASCTATNAAFTLTATDTGALTATSTLNVTATANTPPTLGTYSNTTLTAGGGTTVVASAAPSDNGSVLATGVTTVGSFTGTLSINPATGDVTIANAAPAGVYTVEVIATDNCNQPSTRTFQLTVNAANTAPTITPFTGVSISRGTTSPRSIATVSDNEQPAGSLVVTGTSFPSGLSFIGPTSNNKGSVSASIATSCTAALGSNTIVLNASDGSLSSNANLLVDVTDNTPPVQGTYANAAIGVSAGTTVSPSFAPGDNGGLITSVTVAAVPLFAGTLSVANDGVVTIGNAGPAGVYTITVTATDNCGATSTSSFQLTVNAANAAPTITTVSGLTRQQGSPAINSVIATVTDDAGAGTVVVTSSGAANGFSLTNLVNTNGTVTADLIASCTATNSIFTLTATDAGKLTATGDILPTVIANTPPSQGSYANTVLTAGGGTTVMPSAAPSDNGSVTSVTVDAPGFTGTLSVNPGTGVVTIGNAGPAATYTVTVTATDNCGATSTSSFTLSVSPAAVAELIYGLNFDVNVGRSLVSFNSTTPSNVTTIGVFTGLVSNHFVTAIDSRPATGQLYALSLSNADAEQAQLYTVNTANAVLTPVGPGFTLVGTSAAASMDFNPTVDRLRIVSSDFSRGNYRVNPITGLLVSQDTSVAYAAGDVNFGTPPVNVGVAYTNNVPNAASTTLYAFSFIQNVLATIGGPNGSPSPNTGQMFTVFEPNPAEGGSFDTGFDISGVSGTAFVSYPIMSTAGPRAALGTTSVVFSSVDLASGARTLIGTFPVNIVDIAVAITPPANIAPPTISAVTPQSRTRGTAAMTSIIANVTDDTGNGNVTVTGATTVNGITLSNIVNNAGSVTGSLVASCTAENAEFTLSASDGLNAAVTATLNVTAELNPSPTIGTYGNVQVNSGGSVTSSPNAAPSDNGTVVVTAAAGQGFTGSFDVNSSSGAVQINNAGPASVTPYLITVTVTDNCNTSTTRTFNLTVNPSNVGDPMITATGITRAQGSTFSRSVIANVTDAAGAGNVVVTVNGGATALVQGVEIKAIQNANGVITAAVRGGCFSPSQVQFTLTATSTSGSNTATLPVTVTPGSNPTWCAWWPR